jgi:hypothetical protein
MLLEISDYKPSEKISKHQLTESIPQSTIENEKNGQRWKLCPKCRRITIEVTDYLCGSCMNNIMVLTRDTAVENKTCQHCIERGYENPKPATKQWLNGQFTCDECFDRLSNAITNIPSHFTDYLLNSDDILKHRDEFFNHHHSAIVNLSLEEIHERLEHYKRILFTVRICAEDCQSLIDKVRREAKLKQGLEDKNFDHKKPTTKTAAAGIKLSKEQKLKQSMAKTLGISVEQLEALGKTAVKNELATVTGTTVCEKCRNINCTCKKSEEVVTTQKRCPYCEKIVESLLKHYIECEKRPKKV